jgi:hypothetical protein
MHTKRYQITSYSDNMTAIADPAGDLVAVTTGPRSRANAQTFCDMMEMLDEVEKAGLGTVSDLFRQTEPTQ